MSAKQNGGKPDRRETPPTTRIVFVTALAVAVAVAIGQGWASLILAPAPLIYYLFRPPRDKRVDQLVLRWVPSLLLLLTLSAAFVGPRLSRSVITGVDIHAGTLSWLAGNGAAPFGISTLLATFVAFVVAIIVAGAVGGSAVVAMAVGLASVSAAVVCSNGYNLMQIALVALSPWQWSFLAGLTLMLLAVSGLSFSPRDATTRVLALRTDRRVLAGAALVVAAMLLRVTVAHGYTSLVQHWTIH